ncbi:hypothetical protein MGG_01429 [Pyricularia oryzae 70-15]|uniref:Non-structural maintenance of chromosomes element 1 homolog n=3 Tax=Pyricularia oryzae TaxID=318829 RepID=G4MZL2_PYRO7|nr:uncharacterized protein MGG_01429 [Pyricularia oryzae 70-15]EHA54571.1 hypothetical protein MGG_01429 [Pyricularia oryzae 70-15]ELQ37534.1 hypothetical protein OOU_Y34scaffold00590g48 [Pyricularia oryzae Y34]KAI7931715.1 hypothetical protein M9X92_000033 [Pyricularia oryzae]KAI7932837.1 hypothetical protein M0657_000146 [Pyricularia oryzae]
MDWEPPLPADWTNLHRGFLQAMMARGSMTLEEAQPILSSLHNAEKSVGAAGINMDEIEIEDLEAVLSMIREAISPLDYDIKKHRHQTTKEEVWAFININSDLSTQLATTHTADEMSFIKRLLDAIFDTYNKPRIELMCITADQARKLSRPTRNRESLGVNGDSGASQSATDKGLKHSEVDALMASLTEEGWLEKSAAGFYSLAPRALLELWSWMVESYNDPDAEQGEWQRIKHCEACKDVVTVGQRCSNLECAVRLHDICQEAFWRARRDKQCPKCQTRWEGNFFVGERAITATAAYQRARQIGRGRPSEIVSSAMAEAELDDEEE